MKLTLIISLLAFYSRLVLCNLDGVSLYAQDLSTRLKSKANSEKAGNGLKSGSTLVLSIGERKYQLGFDLTKLSLLRQRSNNDELAKDVNEKLDGISDFLNDLKKQTKLKNVILKTTYNGLLTIEASLGKIRDIFTSDAKEIQKIKNRIEVLSSYIAYIKEKVEAGMYAVVDSFSLPMIKTEPNNSLVHLNHDKLKQAISVDKASGIKSINITVTASDNKIANSSKIKLVGRHELLAIENNEEGSRNLKLIGKNELLGMNVEEDHKNSGNLKLFGKSELLEKVPALNRSIHIDPHTKQLLESEKIYASIEEQLLREIEDYKSNKSKLLGKNLTYGLLKRRTQVQIGKIKIGRLASLEILVEQIKLGFYEDEEIKVLVKSEWKKLLDFLNQSKITYNESLDGKIRAYAIDKGVQFSTKIRRINLIDQQTHFVMLDQLKLAATHYRGPILSEELKFKSISPAVEVRATPLSGDFLKEILKAEQILDRKPREISKEEKEAMEEKQALSKIKTFKDDITNIEDVNKKITELLEEEKSYLVSLNNS